MDSVHVCASCYCSISKTEYITGSVPVVIRMKSAHLKIKALFSVSSSYSGGERIKAQSSMKASLNGTKTEPISRTE